MDGSEFAECVLNEVAGLAKDNPNAEVILLEVVGQILDELSGRIELTTPSSQLATLLEQEASNYLKKEADKLAKKGVKTSTAVVEGKDSEAILEYAAKKKCDLIVLSTHGRTGIRAWALGSVTARVLHASVVPVLVVAPRACRV